MILRLWICPAARLRKTWDEAAARALEVGYPRSSAPAFTMGGTGAGLAFNQGGVRGNRCSKGLDASPRRSLDRGIARRLEGIRARGDARPQRQRRRHLLDRELRPHGRAHGRLDHRGPGADPVRQGVPGDARRRQGHHPRDRRGNRRLNVQFAVRSQNRPHASSSR
jgi:hypothetical protein